MFEESAARSMLKAVSWRVLATLTTTLLVYAFTGRTDLAVTIGLLEAASKMVLYYFHERLWNRLNVGRKPIAGSHPTGVPALASPTGMTDTLTSPDPTAVAEAGRVLETDTPLEILRWATDRYGPRLTFATGFGAEGCALIDMVGRHRLPVDIFTLDTGLLFPETYDLWKRLETRYGITIRRVGPELSVEQQAAVHGPELWAREPDRCCDMRKVTPLVAQLSQFDGWITAIRRDQTDRRADARPVEWDEKFGLAKVNPLVRWTTRNVWAHLLEHDVPYNPLHDLGYPSVGCLPCTSRVNAGEDDRAGRWRGTAKTECGLHANVDGATEVGHAGVRS